jgi:outer membrane protein TolC
VIARRNIEITDLNLKVGHNNTLPAVDFNINYTAVGTGGVQRSLDGVLERGFGTVLGQAFTGDFPTWNVGVSVAYPIGRTAAIAQYTQGQVQKRRQELTLRDTELEVVRQVREAARQVQNSLERIQATQAALTATEQQLEAERRRFAVGLSTTLDMQIRQSQLAQARVNELNARISYNRALINFDRVQKTQ